MKITVSERIDELGINLTNSQRRQVGQLAHRLYKETRGVSPPFEGVYQYQQTEGDLIIIDQAISTEVLVSGTADQRERLQAAKKSGQV